MNLNQAAQNMVSFWEDPRNIPFKCKLISFTDSGKPCMCAQGQTLFKEGGYSVDQLKEMPQEVADKETARILGISVSHSWLLRHINDSRLGAPQDVLTNPEKYLGPNWEAVLKFWHLLDTLSMDELKWEKVGIRFCALDEFYRCYSENAVLKAAEDNIEIFHAKNVFNDCCRGVGLATLEIIGSHKLQEHVFLPMFSNL
jgi:hypothetical protein